MNYIYVSLICTLLLMVCCSSNNDDISLVGSWSERDATKTYTLDSLGQNIVDSSEWQAVFHFYPDFTFQAENENPFGLFSKMGTWNIVGDRIEFQQTYSDTLTFTPQEQTHYWSISSFTENELVVEHFSEAINSYTMDTIRSTFGRTFDRID